MTMIAETLLLLAAAWPQESLMEETEFAGDCARIVKAYEGAERLSKADPRAALAALEEQVLPSLPRTVETTIVVRFSKGATKGAEKERHAFYPFRLAGECALAADKPDRAVEYLRKSPSSGALLERAMAALAEKNRKPVPPPPSPPAPQKPSFSLEPFLERRDYGGALEALRKERERLGTDYDPLVRQVRDDATRHARAAAAAFASTLPRLGQEGFVKNHLEPCLASVAGVPEDLETEELRWIRRLARWIAKPDPAEFDQLSLAALRFDADYQVVCERAQQARLAEVERRVEEARRAPGPERQGVLERLDVAERAFRRLADARPYRELSDGLARALARIPIDSEKLAEARKGVSTVREVRVLASQLELLWTSQDRAKLGDQDQKDLAVYVGIYRCYALFLDGRTTQECADDPRIREVFLNSPPLPKDVSPKVAAVRTRVSPPK
jgi:hypothetical protein